MASLRASCFPLGKQGVRLLNRRLVPSPLPPLVLSSSDHNYDIPKLPQMQQQRAFSSYFSGFNWNLNPMSMMSMDNQEEQFTKQMKQMANKSRWDINSYHKQLDVITKSIRARVTAKVIGQDEFEQAKKSQKISQAIIDHVGADAIATDLENLSQLQELRIANDAEVTVEALQEEIQKFSMASTIHRLLRYLKNEKVAYPKGQEEMKQLMEYYGPSMLSKKEREKMEKQIMENQKRSAGQKL